MNALLQSFLPTALALWVGYVVATDRHGPFAAWTGAARVGVFVVATYCASGVLHSIFGMFSPISGGNTGAESLLSVLLGAILVVAVVRIYMLLGGEIPSAARAAADRLERPE